MTLMIQKGARDQDSDLSSLMGGQMWERWAVLWPLRVYYICGGILL